MFWDKKKSSLPDLPRSPMLNAPAMMNDYQQEEASNELPSFPDSPIQKGFSQTAIKEAVANEPEEDYSNQPVVREAQDYEYPSENVSEWSPAHSQMPAPAMSPIPLPPRQSSRSRSSDGRPVYIRLDKFQNARSSLENVKTKLNEVEDLLKKIREVKAQEDHELTAWEADLESVKHRLETIGAEIFDRGEE